MINGVERKTDFPIFSATNYKNKIFVAGGGGGQKFGIRNYIIAIETATMMETYRLDTGDDLVEKIFANEVEDYLIAISEQKAKVYAINEKGELIERSAIDIPYNEKFQTLTAYYDSTLAMAIEKKLIIYTIKDLRWNKVFEISIDSPIIHLANIEDPNHFFVGVDKKIMVFSVKNSRFIGELPLESKGKGLFISQHKSSNSLFFILSSHTGSDVHIYQKLTENFSKNKFISKMPINRSRITVATMTGDILIIGDINGAIEAIRYVDARMAKIYSKNIHELPPNNIIIKNTPSTVDNDSLMVLSFGADYKIKITELERSLLNKGEKKQRDFILYLLLVLFISILLGYFYYSK